jgi:predicted RNA-binding protein
MCEAHAFILDNGNEKKILESVDVVELEDDKVRLISIFGEQKMFRGRLRLYDNTKGKLLFEPVE